MKLLIELPKEFEEHFTMDKFQDSFMRICGDIRTGRGLCGKYECELADELRKAFNKAKRLKEGNQMSLEVMEHRCDYCGCTGPGIYLDGQESPYKPETRFKLFMCIGCQEKHNHEKQENTEEKAEGKAP